MLCQKFILGLLEHQALSGILGNNIGIFRSFQLAAFRLLFHTRSCSFKQNQGHCVWGSQDRVVSKRVVLADVPLYRSLLRKVFTCSASLAEESCDVWYFWVPKTGTRVHSPNPPFYKTALLFPLGIFRMICMNSNDPFWGSRIATALASYRIEKPPQIQKYRISRKIRFCCPFNNFSLMFAYHSPIFYSVAGRQGTLGLDHQGLLCLALFVLAQNWQADKASKCFQRVSKSFVAKPSKARTVSSPFSSWHWQPGSTSHAPKPTQSLWNAVGPQVPDPEMTFSVTRKWLFRVQQKWLKNDFSLGRRVKFWVNFESLSPERWEVIFESL